MKEYNVSIVVPTWNRCELVDRLLKSLETARKAYRYGRTEVLIVDSSEGKEKENIEESCRKYHALYILGDDSVRKKRNKGICTAQYEFILFIDSDVTAEENLINNHMCTYIENESKHLGGTFGLTEFVGQDNLVWKIIQYSTFLDSFQFAKKFPYQNWTIGNNVMFRRDVLLEVGMFEENFPYKLGADDLEMTYRITHTGYLIRSAPEAVTYHSKDTWKKIRLLFIVPYPELKEKVAALTAELSSYQSIRSRFDVTNLRHENEVLRSKVRRYESVIDRNGLWHLFGTRRGKETAKEEVR